MRLFFLYSCRQLNSQFQDNFATMASETGIKAAATSAERMLWGAVRNIVAAKDALDAALKSPVSSVLVPPELRNSASSAIDVSAFTRAVVPFLDLAHSLHPRRARVPLDRLLGESWRWRQPSSSSRSVTALADYLLDDDRSLPGDRDQAIVFEIAPLGLWFAHEGKNRVHFLRSGGATEMPAMVTTVDYPAAERLALYRPGDLGKGRALVRTGRAPGKALVAAATHPRTVDGLWRGSREPLAAGSAFASYDRRGASAAFASPGDRSGRRPGAASQPYPEKQRRRNGHRTQSL